MNRQRRAGFSLFQLLIILGFLGMGVGLLFPALLKLRGSAARAQSQNNLKQIGIGAFNYESANKTFPAGRDANGFSTAAYLLPYVEQDTLFKAIDFKKSIDDPANAAARKMVVSIYLSPRDKAPAPKTDFGATNYVFNAGTLLTLKDNNGVFFQDSKVRILDITDGTSNTMMNGETLKGDGGTKAMDVRRQHVKLEAKTLKDLPEDAGVQDFKDDKNIAGDRCASWMDGGFLQSTCNAGRQPNDARPDVACAGAGGLSGLRAYDTVVLVGMCDGSVRTISASISKQTWQALATRNGGEVLGNDF